MVFGTFRNPEDFEAQQGFYAGASARLAEMLCFRDVTSDARAELEEPRERRLAA